MSPDFNSSSPNCAALALLLPDYAAGELPAADAVRVAAHLPHCPACQQQLQQLRTLLLDLADLPSPVPPLSLRDNFLAALDQEKTTLAASTPAVAAAVPETPVLPLWAPTPVGRWLRVAASVALLLVGALAGLLLRPLNRPDTAARPAPAPSQLAVQLANAAGQSATASRRLLLVQQAPTSVSPGDPAVQVLVLTLNADPNPNVRLAAAEALYRLRADPRVAPALAQALPNQTDPNVQITLIELLVALRDKRAVLPLEQLARQPGALPAVRQQATQGLGLLI